MKTEARLVLAIAAISLAPQGCGPTIDKPIVTYQRDNVTAPKLSAAQKQGLYALFPGNGVTPLEAVYLNPGDAFGFTAADGKIVGAYTKAGQSHSVPLDGVLTTEYVWKFEGDKQP